jgi:glutathione S-transferase
MAITLYYGSGSPFSWYALLALAHKSVPYELKVLSLRNGELKTPEYLAIHPRGKVPALAHDGVILWESAPIVEYLEERFPDRRLLPSSAVARAVARRIAGEAHGYLYPIVRRLMNETLFRPQGNGDVATIAAAVTELGPELARFEQAVRHETFLEQLTIADLATYPILALLRRLDGRQPQHGVGAMLGPCLRGVMRSVEAQPYYATTVPPHWKEA